MGISSSQVSNKKNADILSARARKYIPIRSFETSKELVQIPTNDENKAPQENLMS
jgi:hypothetical protein